MKNCVRFADCCCDIFARGSSFFNAAPVQRLVKIAYGKFMIDCSSRNIGETYMTVSNA